MNGNPFRASIFAFLICSAILTAAKSFAQDDSSSGTQAGQEDPQMTLEQIRDEELRIQNDLNRLDALDKSDALNRSDAINQALDQSEGAIAQAAPKQEVSTRAAFVEQASDSQAFAGQAPAEKVSQQVPSVQTASAQATPYKAPARVPPPSTPLAWTSASGNTVKISGYARAAMGIDSDGNTIFRRANADLNERNWRLLSSSGLNHNIDTYDPAIYSQLKVIMDASVAAAVVSFHLNLTVDPWSFTGKSKSLLLPTAWGDLAKVQYLWWGNTGYTVNTGNNTLRFGGAFNLPEIKVKGNIVPAISLATTISNQYNQTDTFNIPAVKLDYTFNPVREAWVDIKPNNDFKLRFFPMAYEDQAMTTNDPLKLSNNRQWWAESPWIDGWAQGNFNAGTTPVSFTKGMWDKSLAFLTMDSPGQRLTALRGVSLVYKNDNENETSLNAEIATPKTLWQNYSDINTVPGSIRLQQFIGNQFYIGAMGNMHLGYTTNEKLDAENFVEAADIGARPLSWLKINGEVATSKSIYDVTSHAYDTKYSGNAYYASIEAASPTEQDMLRTDYFGMHPNEKTENFFKSIVYFARMDDNFESSLSDYHFTRSDSFWADDLTFYPSLYRYLPGIVPSQSSADLEPFAVGNGIDYGRSVVSWRADENLLEGKLQALEDVRHVTDNATGKNIENVYRASATYQATDKLTTKALFLYNALPKTTAGVDPFLIEDNTAGEKYLNTAVPGGKDPSSKTGSLGARYQLTDWAAINGVWDYTNDIYLSTGSFPNGDLNSVYYSTYVQNGKTYTTEVPQLYDQAYFEQAPYPYHNIFKAGLEIDPTKQWHIYTDYTRNPNKFAGNIDDNMNHFGLETSYLLTPKIGFFARYTLSNGYDINRLVHNNELDFRYYNNFFFETRMVLPKDVTMSIQYGVGPAYNVQTSSTSPDLAYYSASVLNTQHIIRIIFDKKF